MNDSNFHRFIFLLSIWGCFLLPAVATAEGPQGLGWVYERIDIYRAIEYNKQRIQNSRSEAEKKQARELLKKDYARAIDSAQGERRQKLILEAHADLPEWWEPAFRLAVLKYEKFKEAILHSDNEQADILIKEACDLAESAKKKNGIPKKYRSTCRLIIGDYQRTKQFAAHGIAHNVRQNCLDLKGDNREYLIESIPDEFIQQGLLKEGDIIEVVVKPRMALRTGSYGSSDLKIGGYDFVALNKRSKPGYILTGKIITKKAGAFIVESDNRKNIIVDISKTDYDFFKAGDTIKCRVYQNTRSNSSARHLRLYEIDPESIQTVLMKEKKRPK